MLAVLDVITRWLRIAVPILILAVLATPLAACEDSEPTTTHAATEYEDAIFEWLRVAGPSWSDLVRSMHWLNADFREAAHAALGTGEPGGDPLRAISEELSFDNALEAAYSVRGAIRDLPDVAPPPGYEQFDTEFTGAVSLMRDGLDMFVRSVEEDPTSWWGDGWFEGWSLLRDGHDAFLDAFCYLPRSSSLSHFCTARFEEAP
ncbi:MAG: hypothetical protein ACUVV3_04290 [Dehalococcoidia bacterium]